jgi:hypothetical protein
MALPCDFSALQAGRDATATPLTGACACRGMGWTWPSWLAIVLGVVGAAAGFALHGHASWTSLAPAVVVGGALLLAAGLHGLQSAWASCCAWDEGCDCDHCEGCRGGACCGRCPCYGPGGDEGHEGHDHGAPGHSH